MVSSLTYSPGTPQAPVIDLYDPSGLMIGSIEGLRERRWEYDSGYRSITGVTRPVTDRKLSLTSVNPDLLDRLRLVADADIQNDSPGLITVNGEWSQHAYLTVTEVDGDVPSPSMQQVSLTATMLDGVWSSDMPTIRMYPNSSQQSPDGYLDLPTDMSYDLGIGSSISSVSNPLYNPINWRMIWFGPVSSPHITIAGNTYEVDVDVPDGGYLSIDSVRKTVTLVAADGYSSNAFANAVRGSGIGGGRYIFQPLPAGTSYIEWDGSFGINLIPVLEVTTPPWQTLN